MLTMKYLMKSLNINGRSKMSSDGGCNWNPKPKTKPKPKPENTDFIKENEMKL